MGVGAEEGSERDGHLREHLGLPEELRGLPLGRHVVRRQLYDQRRGDASGLPEAGVNARPAVIGPAFAITAREQSRAFLSFVGGVVFTRAERGCAVPRRQVAKTLFTSPL